MYSLFVCYVAVCVDVASLLNIIDNYLDYYANCVYHYYIDLTELITMTETQRQFINRLHLLIVTNVINTCDQFYNYQDEHYSDMDDESMSFNFAVGNELRFLRTIVSKIFN